MWFWDPFEDMEEMFERVWGRPQRRLLGHGKDKKGQLMPYRSPITDLYETDNSVIATMEIPGVNKEDIELNVTDNQIEVKVEQKHEVKDEDKGYYKYESRCKSFYRSLPIPSEVKAEQAEASYKDGVLKIEIAKKEVKEEKKKKKKIEVK